MFIQKVTFAKLMDGVYVINLDEDNDIGTQCIYIYLKSNK